MKRLLRILGIFWRPVSVNAAFFVFMFVLGYFCTQTEIRLHLKGKALRIICHRTILRPLSALCCPRTVTPEDTEVDTPVACHPLIHCRTDRYVLLCAFRVDTNPHHAHAVLRDYGAGNEGVPELVCGMGPADFQDRMDHPYCFLAYPVEYL